MVSSSYTRAVCRTIRASAHVATRAVLASTHAAVRADVSVAARGTVLAAVRAATRVVDRTVAAARVRWRDG